MSDASVFGPSIGRNDVQEANGNGNGHGEGHGSVVEVGTLAVDRRTRPESVFANTCWGRCRSSRHRGFS